MLHPVIRPLLRLWLRSREPALAAVPRPDDAPIARAAGPDGYRILLLGNGPAAGWGVRSHALALPGQLSRAIAARTGRGVQVDALVDHDRGIADLPELVAGGQPRQVDAVVVIAGMSDVLSLIPLERWRRDLEALIVRVALLAPQAAVLVLGVQEVRSVGTYAGWPAAFGERHRPRVNAVTEATCARLSVAYAPLHEPALPPSRSGHRSPGAYTEWAQSIAESLAPLLECSGRRTRNAQPEDQRQAAVQLLAPEEHGDPRLDRITTLARELFGVPLAALTLLDGDLHRFKSISGGGPEALPRAWSFCARTILADEVLVVGDLASDARFDDNPLVHGEGGVHFYAGYPIESPDGYRVGALCVIDTEPRDVDSIDVASLSQLALEAQKELWATVSR